MWQTKYASAVLKNLGVGVNFRPCSEGWASVVRGMQEEKHLSVYLGSLVQLFNYFKKETYRNRDFNFEFACEKLLTTYFHEKVPKISNCHEFFGLIKLFARKTKQNKQHKQIKQLVVIV